MIRRGMLSTRVRGILMTALIAGLALASGRAFAGENYGNHYPGGQEDFAIRLEGPKSLIVTNYTEIYSAGTLRDNAGKKMSIRGLGDVDFKLDVFSNSTRFIKLTPWKLLGGNVSFTAIVPIVYAHSSVSAGPVDMGSQSKTGLGDIEVGVGPHLVSRKDLLPRNQPRYRGTYRRL